MPADLVEATAAVDRTDSFVAVIAAAVAAGDDVVEVQGLASTVLEADETVAWIDCTEYEA